MTRTIIGLTQQKLNTLLRQLNDVHIGECPPIKDHTRKDHPYKSLWKEQWETKMEQSATLAPYTSINKLIRYSFTATEKAFS